MATFYGEETVYSYESQGGIALMSNDDLPPGTVSGSGYDDEEGGIVLPTRISWTITYEGADIYTGGITNSGFYLDPITIYNTAGEELTIYSPFFGHTAEGLYRMARDKGNLNEVFSDWNNNHPNSVQRFVSYLLDHARGCVSEGTVIG